MPEKIPLENSQYTPRSLVAKEPNPFPVELYERYHEPELQDGFEKEIEAAIEVQQNGVAVLDADSPERYLKTYGVGPCILLVVHDKENQELGVIHFDADPDNESSASLVARLNHQLNKGSIDDYDKKLFGGIKNMEGSEKLYTEIKEYVGEIDQDRAMQIHQSDIAHLHREGAALLAFQSFIIDKVTGKVFKFS